MLGLPPLHGHLRLDLVDLLTWSRVVRLGRIELWKKEGRNPGSCPESTSLRRILRSMSNSRLRTKSLRRLRSIISLSICLEYELSRSASGSRSPQLVAGFLTNRTTLESKPEVVSSLGGMGVLSVFRVSPRTSSA